MIISEVISNEVTRFESETVETVRGVYFSQYKNLQRIDKYLNNVFWECDDPDAIFWNIATPRIPLFAKSLEYNSKDFKMFGIGERNYVKSWILNARFRKWVKDSRFALTLDDTATKTTTYGSSVWKRSKKNGKVVINNVNLRNLYFDPTVEYLKLSPVVEMHYLSETQIRKKYPEKVDEVIAKAKEARDNQENQSETTIDQYEIWERWGDFRDNEEDDYKYMHFIGAGYGDGQVILFEEEIKTDSEGLPVDFPYYDFHIDQYSGRWQRIGVVERLFILQERMNTIVNQNAEATQIASLLLFRSNDANTNGNILRGAISGQIVTSEDLQQIGIDNRAAGTILNEMVIIEKQADDLCFITDSISGETPPSGVPFRSFGVASNASKSTFKFIGTAMGEKMALILQEDIMPAEMKDWKKEDLLEISEGEDDIRMYDKLLVVKALNDYKKDRIKKGLAIFEEDLAEVEAKTLKAVESNKRLIKITKDLWDIEWGIDMNPTGEGMDKNATNAAIDGAIQDMLANPNVVNTPIYKQKLEINGIPPFRLSADEIANLAGTKNAEIAPQVPQEDKLSQQVLQ